MPPDPFKRCTCGRLFGYCHGGHDDTDEENESCDECWARLKEEKGE